MECIVISVEKERNKEGKRLPLWAPADRRLFSRPIKRSGGFLSSEVTISGAPDDVVAHLPVQQGSPGRPMVGLADHRPPPRF